MATPVARSLGSRLGLNDGTDMPLFGVGMSRVNEPLKIVTAALQDGYRLIDTAVRYGNEKEVGLAIADSGVPREELFVVSKLWSENHSYDDCVSSVKDSLTRLGLTYIDLYLIHSPLGGRIVETYDALLSMKQRGLVRSVGVSNFAIPHLEGLRLSGRPLPVVNQIELHPWYQRKDIVTWCSVHGVGVMGYSPLVKGTKFTDPQLLQLAEKYKRTPAQVLLRWSVQHGYVTIPKSSRPQRLKENKDIFGWALKEEDVQDMVAIFKKLGFTVYLCLGPNDSTMARIKVKLVLFNDASRAH